MPLLEFHHISFGNEERLILDSIHFEVEEGDFISIIGASGSGKSTLLKLCGNLISPTSGEIYFQGRNMLSIDPIIWRQQIAYCFQTPYLFGNTVLENMNFPYAIRNRKPDMERIKELLDAFQMSEEYLTRQVQDLSGGEKQRLALIRSLLILPKVLLLDEVTSALDLENTLLVENVLEKLHQEGLTILWVTHNLEQSRRYANKILKIDAGKLAYIGEVRR